MAGCVATCIAYMLNRRPMCCSHSVGVMRPAAHAHSWLAIHANEHTGVLATCAYSKPYRPEGHLEGAAVPTAAAQPPRIPRHAHENTRALRHVRGSQLHALCLQGATPRARGRPPHSCRGLNAADIACGSDAEVWHAWLVSGPRTDTGAPSSACAWATLVAAQRRHPARAFTHLAVPKQGRWDGINVSAAEQDAGRLGYRTRVRAAGADVLPCGSQLDTGGGRLDSGGGLLEFEQSAKRMTSLNTLSGAVPCNVALGENGREHVCPAGWNTHAGFGCAASKLAAQTYPACAATDAKELRVGAVVDGDTVTGKQVDSGAVGSGALGLLQNSVQQLRAGAASHRHAYPLRALSMQQQSKGSSEPHNFCITTTDNMPRCTAAIFSEKAGMCAAHIMKVETPTELGAPRWHWPLPTRAQKLKQALESPRSPSTSSNDVSASAAPPTSVLPTAADKILSSSWSGPLSSLVRGGSVSHAVPSTPGEIQQLHAQPLTAYASAPGTPTRAASRMAGPRQSSMASDELRSQCGMSPSLGARPSSNLAQLNLTRQFSSAGSLPSLRPASSAGPLTTSRPGFGASRYSGTVDRSSTATLQREGHYAAMARMQTPLQHETAGRAAAPPPPRQTCTRSWAPPATAFVLSSELPSRGAVYSVFQNLDPRSNGQVVFSDFEEAGILVGMTHTQIQNLFKALDKAGKGYLTGEHNDSVLFLVMERVILSLRQALKSSVTEAELPMIEVCCKTDVVVAHDNTSSLGSDTQASRRKDKSKFFAQQSLLTHAHELQPSPMCVTPVLTICSRSA
eukprot:364100-Chlamydomonas_euryale.AAC.30